MNMSKLIFEKLQGKTKEQVQPFIIIGVWILVILVFTIINASFFSLKNFHSILLTGVVVGIIAVGECVALTATYFDMSVGMVAAMGGLAAAKIMQSTHNSFLAFLAGICVGVLCGLLAGLCVSMLNMNAFITTFALQEIYRGVIYVFTNGFPISLFNAEFSSFTKWGKMKVFGFLQFPILALIIIYVLVALLMKYRKLGRSIYLVGGNAKCAEICGINIHRVQIFCFVLCNVLASFAGMLYASRTSSAAAFLGENIVMESIAATIVGGTSMAGGKSNLFLTFIGVMIVYSVKNGLIMIGLPDFYQYIAIGIILFLAVMMQVERIKS